MTAALDPAKWLNTLVGALLFSILVPLVIASNFNPGTLVLGLQTLATAPLGAWLFTLFPAWL